MFEILIRPFISVIQYFADCIKDFISFDVGYNRFNDPLHKNSPDSAKDEWLKDAFNNRQKHNLELSKRMTDLFEDTTINVIETWSPKPTTMCIAGAVDSSKNYKYDAIYSIPIYGKVVLEYYTWVEQFKNGFLNFSDYNNITLSYNPETKKAKISIPEATIFITSRARELLTDREQEAAMLWEIVKNLQTAAHVTVKALNTALKAYLIFEIARANWLPGKILYKGDNNLLNYTNAKYTVFLVGVYITVLTFFITYIPAYIKRRAHYAQDDIVIKMGYGEELYTSNVKFNKYNIDYNNYALRAPSMNWVEKLLFRMDIWVFKLKQFLNSLWLGEFPSYHNYEEMLKAKNQSYQQDKTLDIKTNPDYKVEKFPFEI